MGRGKKTAEQVKIHLERSQKYQEEHKCSLGEALSKTDFNNYDLEIMYGLYYEEYRNRIATAEAYQKENKCSLIEALSATAEKRKAN